MKINLFIIILFLNCNFFSQENQIKIKISLENNIYFNTKLKYTTNNESIIFTSPKNADKRTFGVLKAEIGRITNTFLKKGNFIQLTASKIQDSLFGTLNAFYLGNLTFNGTFKNDKLIGNLYKNNFLIGKIETLENNTISFNYDSIPLKTKKLLQENLYSNTIFNKRNWNTIEKKLNKYCSKSQDDIELYFSINKFNNKLPFSHCFFIIQDSNQISHMNLNKSVFYDSINESTKLIKVNNFTYSSNEINSILPKVIEDTTVKQLIIDFTDNYGGGIEAAFEFAKYFIEKDILIGYFTTNKFEFSEFEKEKFDNLPISKSTTTFDFLNELSYSNGLKLHFKPDSNIIFKGTIKLLISKKTASTCEPIVYIFQNILNAEIIGEKTAGVMLSCKTFKIENNFYLTIPIADFYMYDGTRLEGKGIKPKN